MNQPDEILIRREDAAKVAELTNDSIRDRGRFAAAIRLIPACYQYECPEGSAQIRAERSSIPTRCLIPFGIIHRDDAEGIVLMRNRLEDAIQVVQAARAALQPKAEPEVKDEAG